MLSAESVFPPQKWFRAGRGPRYQQLYRHMSEAIQLGHLVPGDQLPPERELAEIAQVSRVTVRKAVGQLVADGIIEQQRGAGSFVRSAVPKLEQSLSSLVSFTENMLARGMTSSSVVLSQGVFSPTPQEVMTLGLAPSDRVARIARLRSAGDVPMAIEHSSLPTTILPHPENVKTSLYEVLRGRGQAPTRAIQRVTAVNLGSVDAGLLKLADQTAVLRIDRTGYLATGRPIEFTTGLYRSDIYDFVSELRREEGGFL